MSEDTIKISVEQILKQYLVGKKVKMDDGKFHTVEKCYLDIDHADSPYENDLINLVLVTETDNEFLYKNIIIYNDSLIEIKE